MKAKYACPKCVSSDIIENVRVLSGSEAGYAPAELATYRKPDALVFKGTQKTSLVARVCGHCGFVEFYAQNPESLRVPSA